MTIANMLVVWILACISLVQRSVVLASEGESSAIDSTLHPEKKHLHRKKDADKHKQRCGGESHSRFSRICAKNDTMCGVWRGKYWHPIGCVYEDISPQKAAKCLGNRTLAFIGDSQTRDLMIGVTYFLLEVYTLDTAPEHKFDDHLDINDHGQRIPDFKHWMKNVPEHNFNGYIFPKPSIAAEKNILWQVQMWNFYTGQYLEQGRIEEVLSNELVKQGIGLHPIDLAFWNLGIHDWGWWYEPPYGEKFYDTMVNRWLEKKDLVPVPTVWVGMNNNCEEKLSGSLTGRKKSLQVDMIEEANKYTNKRLLNEKLPYFDLGSPLRTPNRCNNSADGLHVPLRVNIMAAKMLFNHLCDASGKWRGGVKAFI